MLAVVIRKWTGYKDLFGHHKDTRVSVAVAIPVPRTGEPRTELRAPLAY